MCSILLILLIFVIIFDFAHDCAISFDIAEESTQRACPSQTRLVSTSHRSATFRCEDPQEGAQSAQLPPLQRSLFLTENQQSHGGYGRRISMALWHMPQIEQKDSHDMPKVPRPLEPRYKAPYRAKGSSSISVFCYRDTWETWDQNWKQWDKDQTWSSQRPHSASRPRTKSPRHRKGKSKASGTKGKDGKGAGDSFATASPFGPLAPSAPWPAPETATSSSHPIPNCHYVDSISAGCCGYGGGSQGSLPRRGYETPKCERYDRESREGCSQGCSPRASTLLPRHSAEHRRRWAENLDAKQQHRAQWAKHVSEAIQTWQGQLLQSYRKQQTAFQEITNKAKHDIELARNTIQLLNAKAASTGLAATQPLDPEVGGRGGHRCRHRRREVEADHAGSVAELRAVIGIRSCTGTSQRGSGNQVGRRSSSGTQAGKINRTLSRAWFCWHGIVSIGGALPVLCNGMHDAQIDAGFVDSSSNVCKYLLSDCDVHKLLPWSHSIWDEPNFLFPFDAVLCAQSLSLSLYKEDTDCMLGLLQESSEYEIGSFGQTDCASNLLTNPHVPSFAASQLRSCISNGSSKGKRHVCFQECIDLFVGADQEIAMQCISFDADLFLHWTDKPWKLRPSCKETHLSDADPQSAWAVLISRQWDLKMTPDPSHLFQARLTDEHDNIPMRIAQESRDQPPAHAMDERQIPPPAFVTDLFNLPGFLALPPDFLLEQGITIRTWYLHHEHFPRWTVPRFVELDHNWRNWQREIARSWRDMIMPREDVQLFTVTPDPDRSYIPRLIVADVIVAQGSDAGLYAGLLTAHQLTAAGSRRPFAVAVSLPDEVSGVSLANAADIPHLCRNEVCNFYFRWQHIPFSQVHVHYMLDGHGFSVHITPRVRQLAARSSEVASSSLRDQSASAYQHPAPAPAATQEHDYDGDVSEHTTDTSMPGSLSQFEQWQGVQIYRLGRPVVHCFVRWGTYNSIMHDIAHFLREHLRNLIGLHHVQAILAGQHEAEDSIILQYVNDLALGSTEQLVILDVEVHFQPLPDGMLRAPEVSRRVHRVVSQLSRPHILRLARLANYCFLQGDRCLVYHNNAHWHEQDLRVRSVQHGCYFKVVATPPIDNTLATHDALHFAISMRKNQSKFMTAHHEPEIITPFRLSNPMPVRVQFAGTSPHVAALGLIMTIIRCTCIGIGFDIPLRSTTMCLKVGCDDW